MAISRRRALGLMGSAVALPVFGRDAAAAHVIIRRGAAFRLDNNQVGDLTAPALEQTSAGGFLAIWQQRDAGVNGVDRVWGRYYTSTGVPIGAPIQMGGPGAGVGMPVAFADGAAAFLYQDAGIGSDIYAQHMTSTRTKNGLPVKLNTRTVGNQSGVRAERLNIASGNFAAAWIDAAGIGGNDIRSRQFTPTATGASIDIRPTAESAGVEELIDLAPLVGGGAILSYRTNGLSKLQRLHPSGARYGAPIPLGTASPVGVTGMPTGGYAAAWREDYTLSNRMRVRFYAANGAAGAAFWVDIMGANSWPLDWPFALREPRPYLSATSDGRLVIAYWVERVSTVSLLINEVNSHVGVLMFSQTQGELAWKTMASDTQLYEWTPHTTYSVNSLIRLKDGNFVVSWAEAIDDVPPHIVMARRFSAV